ncbi:MAG: SocA family protein [Bacteroidales bacterium]|nr:SocA family protein [Bacteroidales bacterium]
MSIKEKKLLQAILFFANKTSDSTINRLKLMKLLYLADRYHINKYGRLILSEDYHALPNGPTPSKTYDYTKRDMEGFFEVDRYNIIAKSNFDSKYFSQTDLEIMDKVWNEFRIYSPYQLRDLSHLFPEWKEFEKDINDPNAPDSYPINLENFFEEPNTTDYNYNLEESNNARSLYHYNKAIKDILS